MINITDNPDELLDTVNEKDIVTGQARREEVHKNKNLIHRSVGVVIFNKKGEIFLQQRSAGKDTDPLLWTISCSGHVLSGDSYEETALRELKEELGLDLFKLPISLLTQRNRRKKGWPNAGFLIFLTSGDREGPRLRDKPFPSPSPLGKRNNKKPARANLVSIEPVCKYLCRAPNETEMVMIYKAIYNGPFKLNPKEIIQGKFFTRKELLEAIKPTPSVDRPGKMETRRKRGEHPVPSRRYVGIGTGIKLSFVGKVALEKLGWV